MYEDIYQNTLFHEIKIEFFVKKGDDDLQIANNIIKKEFGKRRNERVNPIDEFQKTFND